MQVKPNGQAVITIPKKLKNAKGRQDKEDLEWNLSQEGVLELKEK